MYFHTTNGDHMAAGATSVSRSIDRLLSISNLYIKEPYTQKQQKNSINLNEQETN